MKMGYLVYCLGVFCIALAIVIEQGAPQGGVAAIGIGAVVLSIIMGMTRANKNL